MSGWKLLAATPFLLAPLVLVGISVSEGPAHKAERAAVVLPAAVEGPQVTLRPDRGAGDLGPEDESAGPAPSDDRRCGDQEDADDAGDDDADDDDGVVIVNPCPGAVGDDDDDDDEGDD